MLLLLLVCRCVGFGAGAGAPPPRADVHLVFDVSGTAVALRGPSVAVCVMLVCDGKVVMLSLLLLMLMLVVLVLLLALALLAEFAGLGYWWECEWWGMEMVVVLAAAAMQAL